MHPPFCWLNGWNWGGKTEWVWERDRQSGIGLQPFKIDTRCGTALNAVWPHNKPVCEWVCSCVWVCLPMKICTVCMFVGVCMCAGLSVFFFYSFFCMWVSIWLNVSIPLSCSLFPSLLYLTILWAGADRADVDNYKVFFQRANSGDVCLHRSLSHRSFPSAPFSPLLRLSRFSRNHNTADPKYILK